MKAKELGIAVVGSGRIGTLRARLAAKHPAVRFLAVSDKKVEQAKTLADLTGADFYSTDNNEVIARPEVTAVFVSGRAPRRAFEIGVALSRRCRRHTSGRTRYRCHPATALSPQRRG